MKLSPHPAPTIQPQVIRLRFRHGLLPLLVGLRHQPDRQAPSLHPRYRVSSLLRACPPLRPASVLCPLRVCRLGVSLEHRGWRFPRSAQEPALNSRRLYAGHHSGSKQVAPELCPGATTGLRFRWHPYAFDISSAVHSRSSFQRTPDGFVPPFPKRSLPRPLCRSSFRWFGPWPCSPSPRGPPSSHVQFGCFQVAISASFPRLRGAQSSANRTSLTW